MTIIAITKRYTAEALALIFPGPDIRLVVVKEVNDAEQYPGGDLYLDLDFVPELERVELLNRLLPSLVMVNAVVPTLREIDGPFVRINGWPGFLERSIHELAVSDEQLAGKVKEVYGQLGHAFRFVPDVPGMISSRVLATIINEAYYTWEEKVSTKEEIDIAMRLGTNYPRGPFEWSRLIGLEQVFDLLHVLSRTNARYTPARSLQEAVGELKYD
jgi:3-hydroxybutyryl-CoA dehydrogenase